MQACEPKMIHNPGSTTARHAKGACLIARSDRTQDCVNRRIYTTGPGDVIEGRCDECENLND